MATAFYFIVRRQGGWWITSEGTRIGPFDSENEAAKAAITTARSNEPADQFAEVVAERDTDSFETIYKTDPPD